MIIPRRKVSIIIDEIPDDDVVIGDFVIMDDYLPQTKPRNSLLES
jgi:hypothetical protein